MKRWIVLKSLFVKVIIEMKRYMFNTVSSLVTMYIVFLLLFFGAKAVGGTAFQAGDSLEGLVVGYIVWVFSIMAYSDLSWSISNEAQIGTLEQMYLSPTGFAWVSGSLLVSRFMVNLVMVIALLMVMMLTSGNWLNLDVISLFPLLVVTILGPYGIGFMMGGLALIYKRIQSAFQILQFVFVAFVAVPINQYYWIKYLPLAMGNRLVHQVMVDGDHLWQLPLGDLLVATIVGLAYFLVGLGTFAYCVTVARDRGLMGQY